MTVLNCVQIVSSLMIIAAFVVNARQAGSLRKDVRQKTYLAMVHARSLYDVLLSHPDLLRAHLTSRGLRVSSKRANRRRLYALLKLDIHEGSYLSRQDGLLDEELWQVLCRAMTSDFQSPELKKVWPQVRGYYRSDFADFADQYQGFLPATGWLRRLAGRCRELGGGHSEQGRTVVR